MNSVSAVPTEWGVGGAVGKTGKTKKEIGKDVIQPQLIEQDGVGGRPVGQTRGGV